MRFLSWHTLLFLLFLLGVGVSSNAFLGASALERIPQPIVRDGRVGEEITLRSTPTTPYEKVYFHVKKPDNFSVTLEASSGATGIAEATLSGLHTKKAGTYAVSTTSDRFSGKGGDDSSFSVMAHGVSSTRSLLVVDKTSVRADGEDRAVLSLTLKDEYGNTLGERMIKLVASRGGKNTGVVTHLTDLSGNAKFSLQSKEPGVVSYTIMDSESGAMLEQAVRVVFTSETASSGSSSQYLQANLLAQVDPVPTADPVETTPSSSNDELRGVASSRARTLRVSLPQRGDVNTPLDATVRILDQNGDPVTDYKGTIIFESNDTNATLPLTDEGYTFEGRDLGVHTFFGAVRFREPGEKLVRVSDVDNPALFGEATITIMGSGTATGKEIAVIYPSAGLRIGDSRITVVANSLPNRKTKIFNDEKEVGEVVSSDSGEVRFELTNLSSGKHEVSLRAYDQDDNLLGSSESVVYYADLDAPEITAVRLTPSVPVEPETLVQVEVETEPELSEVRVQVGNLQKDLVEDTGMPGTYVGEIRAPLEPGEYPVQVFLRDRYENVVNEETKTVLVVKGKELGLGQVTATAEKNVVKLVWTAPEDTTLIKEYLVTYGLSPTELIATVKAPGNVSLIEVPNLDYGKMYYFVLTAMGEGDVQLAKTNPLSVQIENQVKDFQSVEVTSLDNALDISWKFSVPEEVGKYSLHYGIQPGTYLEVVEIGSDRERHVLSELINGTVYYFKLQAFDQAGTLLAETTEYSGRAGTGIGGPVIPQDQCTVDVQNLRLVTKGKTRFLEWDLLPNITHYRVYSGTQEGVFDLPLVEVANKSFYQLPEMDKKKEFYYFAVKSYCPESGKESFNMSNILKVESGPALMIALLLALGGGYWWYRRQAV